MDQFYSPEQRKTSERADALIGTAATAAAVVGSIAFYRFAHRSSAGTAISGAITRKARDSYGVAMSKRYGPDGSDRGSLAGGIVPTATRLAGISLKVLRRLSEPDRWGTFTDKNILYGSYGAPPPDLSSHKRRLSKSTISDPRTGEVRGLSSAPGFSQGVKINTPEVGGLSGFFKKAKSLVRASEPDKSFLQNLPTFGKFAATEGKRVINEAVSYERDLARKIGVETSRSSSRSKNLGRFDLMQALGSAEISAKSSSVIAKSGDDHISLYARAENSAYLKFDKESRSHKLGELFSEDSPFVDKSKLGIAPKGYRHGSLDDLIEEVERSSTSVLVENRRAYGGTSVSFNVTTLKNLRDAAKSEGKEIFLGRDVFVRTNEGMSDFAKQLTDLVGVRAGDIVDRSPLRLGRIAGKVVSGISEISLPFMGLLGSPIRPGSLLLPSWVQHWADPASSAVVNHSFGRYSVLSDYGSDIGPLEFMARIARKTSKAAGIDIGGDFGSKSILPRYKSYIQESEMGVRGRYVDQFGSHTTAYFNSGDLSDVRNIFDSLSDDQLNNLYLETFSGYVTKVDRDVKIEALIRHAGHQKTFNLKSFVEPDIAVKEFSEDIVPGPESNLTLAFLPRNLTSKLVGEDLVVGPANLRFGESLREHTSGKLKYQHPGFDNIEDFFTRKAQEANPGASRKQVEQIVISEMENFWGSGGLDKAEYGVHGMFRSIGLGSERAESTSLFTKGLRWLLGVDPSDRPLRWSEAVSGSDVFKSTSDFEIQASYARKVHGLAFLARTEIPQGIMDGTSYFGDSGVLGHESVINLMGRLSPFRDVTRTPDWIVSQSDDVFQSIPGYFFRRTIGIMDELGIGAFSKESRERVLPSWEQVANMDLTSNMFGFLVGKRVLPGYLGITGIGYLNYEMDNLGLTGPVTFMKNRLADLLIFRQEFVASIGLDHISEELEEQLPGIIKSPLSTLSRFVIPTAIGSYFGTTGKIIGTTAGFISSSDWTRSPEDLASIFEGLDFVPIRKGRYWETSYGSFLGGRVTHFRPHTLSMSSDRQDLEDYYTYGPVPTPRALLSGYPGVLDPYAFERERGFDRPYPVTGPSALEEIPILGAVIGVSGFGSIHKPRMFTSQFLDSYTAPESDVEDGLYSSGIITEGPLSGLHGPSLLENLGRESDMIRNQMAPTGMESAANNWNRLGEFSSDFAGIYGFAIKSSLEGLVGPFSSPTENIWDTSRGMMGPEHYFYMFEIGGGLTFSELPRRLFVNYKLNDGINPIRNNMPSWVESDLARLEYGDPYKRFSHPSLVPGRNYEAIHPELRGLDPEQYPIEHRAKILAISAPYDSSTQKLLKEVKQDLDSGYYTTVSNQRAARQALEYNEEILAGRPFRDINDDSLWGELRGGRNFIVQKLFGQESATEAYFRERAYGHEIPAWTSPFSEFILPAIHQNISSEENPLVSVAKNALLGLSLASNLKTAVAYSAAGATTGFAGRAYTETYETVTGENWKPSRRREEEDLDAYFDSLAWLKAWANSDEKEMEKTITGINPYEASESQLLNALSSADKQYFKHFLQANDGKERERILRLVPEYTRGVLQAWWSRRDFKEGIISSDEYYTQQAEYEQNLEYISSSPSVVAQRANAYQPSLGVPDSGWIGWDPSVDLEGVKLQVLEQRGMNTHRAGIWQSDIDRLKTSPHQAPPLTHKGLPPLYGIYSNTFGPNTHTSGSYSISARPNTLRVYADLEHDPREEYKRDLRDGRVRLYG